MVLSLWKNKLLNVTFLFTGIIKGIISLDLLTFKVRCLWNGHFETSLRSYIKRPSCRLLRWNDCRFCPNEQTEFLFEKEMPKTPSFFRRDHEYHCVQLHCSCFSWSSSIKWQCSNKYILSIEYTHSTCNLKYMI